MTAIRHGRRIDWLITRDEIPRYVFWIDTDYHDPARGVLFCPEHP